MENDEDPKKDIAKEVVELVQATFANSNRKARFTLDGRVLESVHYMRERINRCGCVDLCSSCSVIKRWLDTLENRFRLKPTFRLIRGGRE